MPISHITYNQARATFRAHFAGTGLPEPTEVRELWRAVHDCEGIQDVQIHITRTPHRPTIDFALQASYNGGAAMAAVLEILKPQLRSTLLTLTVFAVLRSCGKHGEFRRPSIQVTALHLAPEDLLAFDVALHEALGEPLFNLERAGIEPPPELTQRVVQICAGLGTHVQRVTFRTRVADETWLCNICMLAAPNTN